jgi:nitrous oxidase accessory protein
MKWPWSSQACATSGIDLSSIIVSALLVIVSVHCCSANTISAGQDIQSAISQAILGDSIIVNPGIYAPFEINKPLSIKGNGAIIRAGVQKPGLIISSGNVSVSGFSIYGVGEDITAKFNYYMNNPLTTATKLDLPNAAIIVKDNNLSLSNTTIFDSEVGVYSYSVSGMSLINITLDGCKKGMELQKCNYGRVENCKISNCDKTGLDLRSCTNFALKNNTAERTNLMGLLLKNSKQCEVWDNLFSGCIEGLSLWNSSFIDIRRNKADHNYYAFLVSGSDNNTLIENLAEDNTRNEIVKGFGVGISLQNNSSFNIVALNAVIRNFNGLEVTRGCKINAIYGNNASDNTHGIRMDKCRNNIIYGNNFIKNKINAYENSSRNIWNTTFGNFYSDYSGEDYNRDGLGDTPYDLPGGDSDSADARPLMHPFISNTIDTKDLRAEASSVASYFPEERLPYRKINGAILIRSNKPVTLPKWPQSEPFLDTTKNFEHLRNLI